MDWSFLLEKLIFPLFRLLFVVASSLFIANLLESLRWTTFIAKVSHPLARLGRLNETCAASFSLAFFSSPAANGLLSESYRSGEITKKDIFFANLFNSLPTFLTHLPTQFFLTYAFLGNYSFIYTGLTLLAAFLRTACTLLLGRIYLPVNNNASSLREQKSTPQQVSFSIIWKQCKKRLIKLMLFTIPIYCLMFYAQQVGFFHAIEIFFIKHDMLLSFLSPEAISIVALNIAADSSLSLSAAASMAAHQSLTYPQIIIALLVGNIISSPMRAIRHQFPTYAGYFDPSLAAILICFSQLSRIISLILVTVLYYALSF